MKNLHTVLLALVIFNLNPLAIHAQGNLTPPGAPAPTMVTLSQIEPRTPISFAPFSISQPGSYYLTTNLVLSSGNAITISTNGVTLDLRGFFLSGSAVAGNGILMGTITNVTICNGYIAGFTNGITTTAVLINARVTGVTVSDCRVTGINLGSSPSTIVESCAVNNAGSYGVIAGSISDSTAQYCGNVAIDATVANNCYGESSGGDGVLAYTANNCYGYSTGNNSFGVYAPETATGCYGYSATYYGLDATTANNCIGNGGYAGLFADTASNCYGVTTGSGYALYSPILATGCYANSQGSGYGMYTTVAIGCYCYSVSGIALNAYIANSCYSSTGDGGITYKYNMP